MCNILFVVMEALIETQCQEHSLLPALPPISSTARTGRAALQVTIILQGVWGYTERERNGIAGDFGLDKGVQSFMFSDDLFSLTCYSWQNKKWLLKTLPFGFRVFDISLVRTYKGEEVVY